MGKSSIIAIYLVMFYLTIKLLVFILGNEIFTVYGISIATGSLLIPLWFLIGDIITEIFGYKLFKQVIIIAMSCQFLLAFVCYFSTFLPLLNKNSIQLFYNMPRLAISSLLSLLIGGFVNAYFLAKWKKLVKGRFFFIRCYFTTLLGEIIFSGIAITTQFYGKTSDLALLQLCVSSIGLKLIVNSILIFPTSFIVNLIKYHLQNDHDNSIAVISPVNKL